MQARTVFLFAFCLSCANVKPDFTEPSPKKPASKEVTSTPVVSATSKASAPSSTITTKETPHWRKEKPLPEPGKIMISESTAYYEGSKGSGKTTIPAHEEPAREDSYIDVWGSSPNDVYLVGDNELKALSADGKRIEIKKQGFILHSLDQGKTWQSYLPPDAESVYQIEGSSAEQVFALSHTPNRDAMIFQSTDRGKTWQKHLVPFKATTTTGTSFDGNFWGVHSIGDTIVAVGEGGVIFRSIDNGATWSPVKSGVRQMLWSVTGEGSTFTAVGEDGVILRSTDLGASWKKLKSPSKEILSDIEIDSKGGYFILGTAETFLYSSDGVSWKNQKLSMGSVHYNDAWPDPAGGLYFVGWNEGVFYTKDNGATGETKYTNTTSKDILIGIWGSSSDDLYTVGSDDGILRYY
jgi:photosystem II stability/assembly factor-like uncharacterized protein